MPELLPLRRTWTFPVLLLVFAAAHIWWFAPSIGDLDAMNFVLAVREFDVTAHRPHPPGAPVYVVLGMLATWTWSGAGMSAPPFGGREVAALAALSLVAALTLLLAWRSVLRRVVQDAEVADTAWLLAAAGPLLWILAVQPLADVPGLAAVLVAQAVLLRGSAAALASGAFLGGLASGLRVQNAVLFLPVMLWSTLRRPVPGRNLLRAGGAYVVGVAFWIVPVLLQTGISRYVAALSWQTRHDATNQAVLAVAPTWQLAVTTVLNTFVLPWGPLWLAIPMVALAGVGTVVLARRRQLGLLAVLIGPYVVYHLLLQETATVRYALPVAIWMAWLAAAGLSAWPRGARRGGLLALAATSLGVGVQALHAAQNPLPISRAVLSIDARLQSPRQAEPVLYHKSLKVSVRRAAEILGREDLDLRRSPPGYEWRGVAETWREPGVRSVWFIADPRRTDTRLVDPAARESDDTYRLPPPLDRLLAGSRPSGIRVIRYRRPSWVAVRGFALTPEIAGVSARDAEGPEAGGGIALVRPFSGSSVLLMGGRHLGAPTDPPVSITAAIGEHVLARAQASPQERQFMGMWLVDLPRTAAGSQSFTELRITSSAAGRQDPPKVAVEQFDFQPASQVISGFADGWYEPELNPRSGQVWRWAGPRSSLRIWNAGRDVRVRLRGSVPTHVYGEQARLTLKAGDRVMGKFTAGRAFAHEVHLSKAVLGACGGRISIVSDKEFVPKERSQSQDARRLAFQLFELQVSPLP